jgi:simple sugar transport system permease protein
MGAFMAVFGSHFTSSAAWGTLSAISGGIFMAILFAEFHLRRPGDPIVVSIAINLISLGLSTYLLRAIFDVSGVFQSDQIQKISLLDIPMLENIPFIGSFFSGQSLLFYFSLAVVLFAHFFFKYHQLGIWLRAAGENKQALEAGGVSSKKIQFLALILCGALCGLGGAQLSISNVGLFVENMSAGRGWIAVVIVLVTGGRALPLLGLVFLFGTVDSTALRVQGFGLPQQFTEMMPYLASLLALIFVCYRKLKFDKNTQGIRNV